MKYLLLIALMLGLSYADNAKTVWNKLTKAGLTKAGAAGMMGNLQAESGMRSVIYENAYKNKVGLTDQQYVDKVNNGQYSADKFIHDAVGFGLAQWTYHTRKKALLNKCKGKIGDLNCQVDYLIAELKNYFPGVNSLLRKSGNIRECAVKVLKDFENPADKSQSVQDYRTKLAQGFYNKYA